MSKLFVYGDSWAFGTGLPDRHTMAWPVLLGKILGYEVANHSEEGTSIEHLVYRFINDINYTIPGQNDKVMFCLTSKSRSMFFNENKRVELHPTGQSNAEHAYYKYLYSDKLANYNFQKNVLLCKLLCDSYPLECYFVSGWEYITEENKVPGCNFYNSTLLGILHPERNNMIEDTKVGGPIWDPSPYLYKNRHPNVKGHQKIAEVLARWIS